VYALQAEDPPAKRECRSKTYQIVEDDLVNVSYALWIYIMKTMLHLENPRNMCATVYVDSKAPDAVLKLLDISNVSFWAHVMNGWLQYEDHLTLNFRHSDLLDIEADKGCSMRDVLRPTSLFKQIPATEEEYDNTFNSLKRGGSTSMFAWLVFMRAVFTNDDILRCSRHEIFSDFCFRMVGIDPDFANSGARQKANIKLFHKAARKLDQMEDMIPDYELEADRILLDAYIEIQIQDRRDFMDVAFDTVI